MNRTPHHKSIIGGVSAIHNKFNAKENYENVVAEYKNKDSIPKPYMSSELKQTQKPLVV